jgi:ABC-type hemin transport system substrate-binding protein
VTDQPASTTSTTEPAAALPAPDTGPVAQLSAQLSAKPEIAVGGAFAGGLVLGLLLKRLAS